MSEHAVGRVHAARHLNHFHFGESAGIAVRIDKGQFGERQILFDDDRLVFRAPQKARDVTLQIVVIEVEAVGDFVQMLQLQVFAREDNAPGGLVIHDDAAIAVENLAARRAHRYHFHAIAFGTFAIDVRALNLQLPEAGNQEEENGDGGVLEARHLGGGEAGFIARQQVPGHLLRFFGMEFRGGS